MRWVWALLLLVAPAAGKEAELDGRVALRAVHSTYADDAAPDVTLVFLETDAVAADLTGPDGLRLQLDATFIVDDTDDVARLDGPAPAHDRRFGRTESIDQVRQIYATQPKLFGRLDVSLGRMYLESAGNPWVDGLDLKLWLDGGRTSVGIYGGVRPDPIDHSVSTEQQATGAYGTFHRDGFDGALGFNVVLRDGETDRQFIFNRTHTKLTDGLYLATYLTLDAADEVDSTILLATIDYTPVRAFNLTLSVTRYSLERYRDQTIYRDVVEENQAVLLGDEVLDLVYHRARLSLTYRFYRSLVHYQWIEYKHRQQDAADAWFYTLGLREESLAGTGLEVDVRAALRHNFKSDSWRVGLDLSKDLPFRLSAQAWVTFLSARSVDHSEGLPQRVFDELQEMLWLGVQLTWRPLRTHHVHAMYDLRRETELQDARNDDEAVIHTLMGRYAWVF